MVQFSFVSIFKLLLKVWFLKGRLFFCRLMGSLNVLVLFGIKVPKRLNSEFVSEEAKKLKNYKLINEKWKFEKGKKNQI